MSDSLGCPMYYYYFEAAKYDFNFMLWLWWDSGKTKIWNIKKNDYICCIFVDLLRNCENRVYIVEPVVEKELKFTDTDDLKM